MAGGLIYHICTRDDWAAAKAAGIYAGPAGARPEGFIHFSTAAQAGASAAVHLAGREDLVLLTVEAAALGPALRWETARGGARFPHLYGPLPLDAVRAVADLPLGPDGRHLFPRRAPG
jgi:uncharacterized protein (DUF952 family)